VRAIQVSASPAVAQQLSKVAEEVSGRDCVILVVSDNGSATTLEQFLQASPGPRSINLMIRFR
jgi:hypothetical protein